MAGRPINVLIIEDNPSDYEIMRRFLLKKDTNYLTDAVFNVQNAASLSTAKLGLLKDTVDIILLDLALPDSYGLSALSALRKIVPHLPIVILTGVPDENWALQVIKMGAQDYLFKGEINRHQLVRAIYYAIERHRKDMALRESEIRFRASVESMQDGFAIYSAVRDENRNIVDFKYEYINEAGGRLNFTDSENLIGKRLLDVLPNHKPSGLFDHFVRVVETGNPLLLDEVEYTDVFEGVYLHRFFDFRATRLADGFAVVWRDVTDQRKTISALANYASQMAGLYQTTLEINSQLDLNKLLQSIVERAVKLTGGSIGILYLISPFDQMLDLVIGYNLPAQYIGARQAIGEGLAGKVAQTHELMWVPDYQEWEGRMDLYKDTPFRRALSVPLIFRGKVIGVIDVSDTVSTENFTDEQIRLVRLFADQAAIAIDNARLYAEIQQQAITDELTGLYNRRGLTQLGTREVQRSQRYGYPLSAILIDIDFLKHINDSYGHATGDLVLQTIAGVLHENTRGLDIVARIGGDEFVILLLENQQESALQISQRLQHMIRSIPIPSEQGEFRFSVSMGIAELTEDIPDLAALIDQADQALYRAKAGGRNQAIHYQGELT